MRPLIPFIFSFFVLTVTGCFPTREGGPDTAVRPDDGTVLVEQDAPTVDGEGLSPDDDEIPDLPDLSDASDTPDASDGSDLPDDTVTDDTPLPDEDLPPVAVFFDDQVRARTLAELGRATEQVRFVSYTFSDDGVLAALNALHGKGVGVRGVTGTTITAGAPLFPVRTYAESGDSGIVHTKFFVVDGATSLLSSSNIAYQDLRNFLVIIRDDPALAAALEEEFRQLDEEGRGTAKTRHCDPSCPT
ncbi:MAG TPA: phospholipase D family protein, partial [bacterium]|nr:phospholipase D family protein [bacterium]